MLDRPAGENDPGPPPRRAGRGLAMGYGTEEPLTGRSIACALRRRRVPLAACIILVPLLAYVAISRTPLRYTAVGTLIYEPSEYRLRELQSILQADPATESVMASQAEILKSLRIAQGVAERGNFFADPEFNPTLRPSGFWPWAHEDEPPEEAAPGPVIDAGRNATLLAVQAALDARTVKFSRVLEVRFTASDPVKAAGAVNNAMDIYIKDQFKAKARAVRRATEWLEKRAEELREQTRRAEDQIAAYRAQQGLVQGMHAGADAEQISHLTEDLVRARGDLARAEARLDAARGKAGAAAQAAIAPSVVQLRVQQDQLAAQLEAQRGRLAANHPDLVSLQRQLAEAQRAVNNETARVVVATEAELRAARERVAVLTQDLQQAQQEADRVAEARIPLNALMRDAEAARNQLQAVLERIQQTAQQAALETPEAHEISLAVPPGSPSWPRTRPMMAAAAASGLMLGLLLAYILELSDTSLRSGQELRAATGRRCLALVPELGRRAQSRVRLADYAARRPLTPFAEQVRALRAALMVEAGRPRIVAITSTRAAEGKTTTALSLARSAALSGERVILVECDLRQPVLCNLIGLGRSAALAELLEGRVELEQVMQTDPLTGMHVLPASHTRADVLALFISEAMGRLLQKLRAEYDLIVLDTSPAQVTAESRILAGLADATVVCARWSSTPRAMVQHTLELLEDGQANVSGVVLTRVDARVHVRSGYADSEVYHRRLRKKVWS
jgi:succinoglycan biosynthesis transport protein ExoP